MTDLPFRVARGTSWFCLVPEEGEVLGVIGQNSFMDPHASGSEQPGTYFLGNYVTKMNWKTAKCETWEDPKFEYLAGLEWREGEVCYYFPYDFEEMPLEVTTTVREEPYELLVRGSARYAHRP